MSTLSQLIEEHGAAISKIESDFSTINEEDAFPYERIYSVFNDERPVITVSVTGSNAYKILDQVQEGMIGQIDPEAVHVPFYEQIFGGTIRLPLSGLRNRQLITQLLLDERMIMKAKINQRACQVLDNATSASQKGWDGEPLGDTAHPLISGGTQSNLLSGNAAAAGLSAANFKKAYNALIGLTNQSGVEMAQMLDTIIVPHQLASTAKELSESLLIPGSSNNDANIAHGVDYIIAPTLSNSKNWFAVNRRAMKRNMHLYYQEPFQIMTDGMTKDSVYMYLPTRVVAAWGFLSHEWVIVNNVT